MKYYAVKVGREPGIYQTWEECKENVDGIYGAKYKSFLTEEEARNYLDGISEEIDSSKPIAYVDGSFNSQTNEYSFGVVLIVDGVESYFKKSFKPDYMSSMRNVAGEIKGAGFIIQYAINRGIKDLTVYHDYEGISKWYLGEWKSNQEGTNAYVDFAKGAKDKINVNFVKVKGHSNNKYNDMADRLAKEALGIK